MQLSLFDNVNTEEEVTAPFLGRKITVTGTFPQGRQSLRSTLMRLGAAEVRYDKLQRGTHFVLCGENPDPDVMGYHKLYVHDGYNIRLLTAQDLQEILHGNNNTYLMPEEIRKDLHITKEHLYWEAPEICGLKNQRQKSPVCLDKDDILYGKEIFVHISILNEQPEIAQALGCLGAYANTEMAEDTDCILISRDMPEAVCKDVERYYNESRATQFNIPFIILEDLTDFLLHRSQKFPDETLSALLTGPAKFLL